MIQNLSVELDALFILLLQYLMELYTIYTPATHYKVFLNYPSPTCIIKIKNTKLKLIDNRGIHPPTEKTHSKQDMFFCLQLLFAYQTKIG